MKRSSPQSGKRCGLHLVLAAIYFRGTYRPTIIDAPMFHFRVRDGTGWGHWAMTTRLRQGLTYLPNVWEFARCFRGRADIRVVGKFIGISRI